MPSTYTSSLRLTLPATGELSGTWGTTVNTGITELTDAAIAGYASVAMTDADYTLTVANGATDQARRMMLNMTGTLTGARNVICPTASKLYVIKNATTGGFAITLKTSAGTGISIPNGSSMLLMCDGTNVVDAVTQFSSGTFTNLAYTGTLTGGTGIVNLGSGQFYKDASGNVGIGTTAPATKLHAIGQIIRLQDAQGALQIYKDATPTKAGRLTLNTAATDALALGIYNGTVWNDAIVIDQTGNVGIGTSSPSAGVKLDVNGAIQAASSAANTTAANLVAAAGYVSNLRFLRSGYAEWFLGSRNNDTAFNITVTDANHAAPNFSITSGGNVGIGTSSPAAKLEVTGDIQQTWATSMDRFIGSKFSTTYELGLHFLESGRETRIVSKAADSNDKITFYTGVTPTERMRLDSSGNLGIGTSSPGYKLDVGVGANTIAQQWQGAGTSFTLRLKSGDGSVMNSSVYRLYMDYGNGTHTNGYIDFYRGGDGITGFLAFGAAGGESMRLDASGNLGIGTTSPGAKLNVYGTTKIGEGVASNTSKLMVDTISGVAAGIQLLQDGNESWIMEIPASSTALRWAASGVEYMRLNYTGLGIGTSSPTYKLVVSNAGAEGLEFSPTGGINSGGFIQAYNRSGAAFFDLTYYASGHHWTYGPTGAAVGMRLDSSGNFGLGVTPSAWASNYRVLQQAEGGGALVTRTDSVQTHLASNWYYDGTDKYYAAGAASRYTQISGQHQWFTAGAGTSGAAISFTQAMTLTAAGELLVNRTSASGFGKLNVDGGADFTGGNVLLCRDSGNVGIGTSSPSGKLNIVGGSLAASVTGLSIATDLATGRLVTDASSSRISSLNSYYDTQTLELSQGSTSGYVSGVVIAARSATSTAPDSVTFWTRSAERMRLDASGNLGLGVTPKTTTSAYKAFEFGQSGYLAAAASGPGVVMASNAYLAAGAIYTYSTTGVASYYEQSAGANRWYTALSGTAGAAISFTQAMTLDASGQLMVKTTSASGAGITIGAGGTMFVRSADDASVASVGADNGGATTISAYKATGGTLVFTTANTSGSNAERARIDSSGNLLVGLAAAIGNERLCVEKDLNADYLAKFRNTNTASPFGVLVAYTAAAPNNSSSSFIQCTDNAGGFTLRFNVRSNGGIANYSANDVNLSDRREKTNFAPAKSYLDTICAIPVQTFNYIDQSEDDPGLTLGVVAQDVQAVAPELVMESNWGTEDDPKMRLSIYQTDLQYALMKCIQEQQVLITDLRARVALLEKA